MCVIGMPVSEDPSKDDVVDMIQSSYCFIRSQRYYTRSTVRYSCTVHCLGYLITFPQRGASGIRITPWDLED